MTDQPRAGDAREIFTDRAGGYGRMTWHDRYARALVDVLALRPGMVVVDAGAGTGFASRAVARAVGAPGQVIAVDVTPAMLDRLDPRAGPGAAPIHRVVGDATALALPDGGVDAVVCSAALLYLPVDRALAEWRRVLRPGGLVGFSTMVAGEPPAAGLFHRLAAEAGAVVRDPATRLGSPQASSSALHRAGFTDVEVVGRTVAFTDEDLDGAWAAHERGFRAELAPLGDEAVAGLRQRYEAALRDLPGRHTARVLCATGRVPRLG